jgi:hypothetical protein
MTIAKLRHGKSYIKLLFEIDYERMTFRDLQTCSINSDYENEKE